MATQGMGGGGRGTVGRCHLSDLQSSGREETFPLTRAGKEPAEDVKRSLQRAIELAGLKVHEVRMYKMPDMECRVVHGTAVPEGWTHEQPAIDLLTKVGFDGSIREVEIRCPATDGDPLMEVFRAPRLQRCCCGLAELPTTLKEVWVARRQTITRLEAGETPPIFDGKWTWALVDMPFFGVEGE